MHLALLQFHIPWEDKTQSILRMRRHLKRLQAHAVDLVLFPEMSLTGFSMHTAITKEAHLETVQLIQQLAEYYQTAIGIGWVKDCDARCENHYSIVSASGVLLDYAKLHPFRYGGEDQFFLGGIALPTCTLCGFRIGTAICYDLRFPEVFQALSQRADLILIPANWPAARRMHWNCLLQARAIETLSYIAGINCAGSIGEQTYSGDSICYHPNGTPLPCEILPGEPDCPEERILLYHLEETPAAYRASFPVQQDRRPSLYANWYQR